VEDVSAVQILVTESAARRALRLALAAGLIVFRPMLVAAGWALRGKTPAERRPGYVLTIRRDDGGAEQARIEGEVLGALPRRGDRLSLWGHRTYGVLIVRDGYNHSVNGEIGIG
jgi:hypothetical protein